MVNPVRTIRLMLRLQSILKEIEQMKGMKFSVNFVIQVMGVIAHAAAQISDFLPEEGKVWASVAIAAAQGMVGVLAHFRNPDGTPASQPYRPK